MKYYDMHEQIYKQRQSKNQVSWDGHQDLSEALTSSMNTTLHKMLLDQGQTLQGLKTLDLGTGTGTCALFCAQHGADALGVDLSKTAVSMAVQNSLELGLSAQFLQADITELNLNEKFDLITDSSLLHCLVGPDRKKFYDVVKKHLNSNGKLFIHTMIQSLDMSRMIDEDFFTFKDDILWSTGFSEIETDRIILVGKSYFPHRTILSEASLLDELSQNGFRPVSKRITPLKGHPHTLAAIYTV